MAENERKKDSEVKKILDSIQRMSDIFRNRNTKYPMVFLFAFKFHTLKCAQPKKN